MYIDMTVVVKFLFSLFFVFPLFLDMAIDMHANEFEAKEKQKLTERKN